MSRTALVNRLSSKGRDQERRQIARDINHTTVQPLVGLKPEGLVAVTEELAVGFNHSSYVNLRQLQQADAKVAKLGNTTSIEAEALLHTCVSGSANMKAAQLIKHTITKASDALYLMVQLFKFMFDPALSRTYFPELERKSKIAILSENLFWFARYGDVNRFYYVLGLDCKNGVGKSEVMSYRKFMRIRNRRNLNPNGADFNYVCILRDKFVFSQFLTSLNFPTPKNEAILTSEQITWLRDARRAPLETLAECKEIFVDGFCKEVSGTRGSGAFRLRIDRGKMFINENEASLGELKEQLFGRHLLQERVIQHSRMSELHPHSVNTLRLVTYNNNGTVKLFFVALKIGTYGRSVDNWGAGNIAIRIDLETGRLWKEGVFYPGYGGRTERHPDTGVLFRDFEIPYFHAAVEMACKLHSYLYGVHSIGWDIAITEDGPMFIEGNDDWGGGLPLSLKENFKSSFMEMYSKTK